MNVIQKESIECLRDFVEKCELNNYQYFLVFGSLIGAVRHKGFIPWDDDIDIAMPRKDYEAFIQCYKGYYSDNYFLDCYNANHYLNNQPNCRIDFQKLMIRKDKNDKEFWYNAFISICPIDGLPNNRFCRNIHLFLCKSLYFLLRVARSSVNGVDDNIKRSSIEGFFIFLNNHIRIGKILSPVRIVRCYNKLRSKYSFEKTDYSYIYWSNKIYKSNYFLKDQIVIFEGINVRIPEEYDILLREMYGDYMKVPPEEKRIPAHAYDYKILND